jgi:hypothetical protein
MGSSSSLGDIFIGGRAELASSFDSVVQSAEGGWEKLTTKVPVLKQTVPIKGRSVPVWLIGAVGIGTLVTSFLLVLFLGSLGGEEKEKQGPEKAVSVAPIVPPAAAMPSATTTAQAEAQTGKADAIEKILEIPIYKRKLEDWIALGRGYAERKQYKESVTAYRSALSLKRSLAENPQILADLRKAGEDRDAYMVVINLCERPLKQKGLDMIWDIWVGTRDDPSKRAINQMAYKKLTILRRRGTDSLDIAVQLTEATKCSTYAKLMSSAATHADARSLEVLEKIDSTRGCGTLKMSECYPCLREPGVKEDLAAALAQAKTIPAPRFDGKSD